MDLDWASCRRTPAWPVRGKSLGSGAPPATALPDVPEHLRRWQHTLSPAVGVVRRTSAGSTGSLGGSIGGSGGTSTRKSRIPQAAAGLKEAPRPHHDDTAAEPLDRRGHGLGHGLGLGLTTSDLPASRAPAPNGALPRGTATTLAAAPATTGLGRTLRRKKAIIGAYVAGRRAAPGPEPELDPRPAAAAQVSGGSPSKQQPAPAPAPSPAHTPRHLATPLSATSASATPSLRGSPFSYASYASHATYSTAPTAASVCSSSPALPVSARKTATAAAAAAVNKPFARATTSSRRIRPPELAHLDTTPAALGRAGSSLTSAPATASSTSPARPTREGVPNLDLPVRRFGPIQTGVAPRQQQQQQQQQARAAQSHSAHSSFGFGTPRSTRSPDTAFGRLGAPDSKLARRPVPEPANDAASDGQRALPKWPKSTRVSMSSHDFVAARSAPAYLRGTGDGKIASGSASAGAVRTSTGSDTTATATSAQGASPEPLTGDTSQTSQTSQSSLPTQPAQHPQAKRQSVLTSTGNAASDSHASHALHARSRLWPRPDARKLSKPRKAASSVSESVASASVIDGPDARPRSKTAAFKAMFSRAASRSMRRAAPDPPTQAIRAVQTVQTVAVFISPPVHNAPATHYIPASLQGDWDEAAQLEEVEKVLNEVGEDGEPDVPRHHAPPSRGDGDGHQDTLDDGYGIVDVMLSPGLRQQFGLLHGEEVRAVPTQTALQGDAEISAQPVPALCIDTAPPPRRLRHFGNRSASAAPTSAPAGGSLDIAPLHRPDDLKTDCSCSSLSDAPASRPVPMPASSPASLARQAPSAVDLWREYDDYLIQVATTVQGPPRTDDSSAGTTKASAQSLAKSKTAFPPIGAMAAKPELSPFQGTERRSGLDVHPALRPRQPKAAETEPGLAPPDPDKHRNSQSSMQSQASHASESSSDTSTMAKLATYHASSLQLAALRVCKWLTFDRVLFSPAHARCLRGAVDSVVVVDSLGKDWALFCAEAYPKVAVTALSPAREQARARPPSLHYAAAPAGFRHTPHDLQHGLRWALADASVGAVVIRFPPVMHDGHLAFAMAEARRVLRPGGHLELTLLDLDLANMGNLARAAVRQLKARLQRADSRLSLQSAIDSAEQHVGRAGFENLYRSVVAVPVAGVLSPVPSLQRMPGAISADTAATTSTDHSDYQLARLVARVGRWWYSHSYERPLHRRPLDDGMWASPALMRECADQATTFKMLVLYANKPAPQRQTRSA